MKLLMISGDRSMLAGKQGAFWHTLEVFSKHWERIDIICPRAEGGVQKHQSVTFFGNVHFHPSPHALWRQPQWIHAKGTELIALHQHSVMTVHEYPPFYNGIGARHLSKKTGVPCVLEVHHIVGYPVAASAIEHIGRALSWMFLPHEINTTAATRVVNKTTAETLIRWGAKQERVRVVPSFYLDRSLHAHVGNVASRYDVAFCGRLVANKGVAGLLRALALIPHATLLIVGDGPERSKLERLARDLGVAPRVEFRGWLPTQTDVLRAVTSAKVLVMNSTSEGGPRVVLEAMACGMPVIATRVGVMPDVIDDGENGFFTTGTPDDLAAIIGRIITDDALRARVGAKASLILDRFERDRLIQHYAAFLQSVVI